ncbi:MAG TPA: D-arabinono-1,4-lactone oxidase [Solirubrobacteraceae bacterium]|nr:D-arabinono-1,4-lactone oxidase [Solirubrobacteraceae bacterium]
MSEPSGRHQGADTAQWRNWAGDQRCRPAAIERPGSVAEIAAALERAAAHDQRVRVAGAGHSFSDIALTDGRLLTLDRMSRVLDVDRASGLVRVQGGITIHALNVRLAEHGLAMENLGDIDVQTIAGAISTATHGTGAGLRNISSQVAALTLVLADGSTRECSERDDPELLRAARVGLGALGVVAEVTLRCVPAFTLRGLDAPAPLEETLARFDELAAVNDHFEFFVFPHAPTALTRTNNRTDEAPRPRGRMSAYANDVLLTNHAFGLFCRLGRRLPSQIPRINRLVTRLAGTSRRVDRSEKIFASPRLVRFTEMEYSVPRERTVEAVRRVLELVEDGSRGDGSREGGSRQGRQRRGGTWLGSAPGPFAVPFPVEVRTVAADDALISTAAGRDSGFVAVHMYEGMEWEPYFRAVEAVMDELDGRPHWGKRHFQTAATLRGRYPEWDRFQAVRRRLDPGGRFANAYTERVLGPLGGGPGGGR